MTGIQSGELLVWAVTHSDATRTATAASDFPEKCVEPEPSSQPIGIFGCVIDRGDTYDVVFGYENDNPVDIYVQIGVANFVLPKPVNRGQPTLFSPGRHEDAFRVRGVPNNRLVVWSLSYRGTRFAAVSSTYPIRCSGSENPRPVEIAPLCVRRDGATYTAVFSYANLTREDVIIPVGSGNRVAPAPVDQGQPTVFRSGIVPFAFSVPDVPVGRDVTWTVASAGQVDTARASADLGRDCSLVSVEGNADLDLTKVARPDSVEVGARIEYKITVHNAEPLPCSRRSYSTARSTDGYSSCRPPPQQGTAASWVRAHRASACAACSATSPRTSRPRSSSRHGRASRDGPSTALPS